MAIAKNKTHQWTIEGASLKAEISPCSWMYPGYGLQLKVTLNEGCAYLKSKVTFEDATDELFLEMCDQVKLVKCSCGNAAFDPATIDTNRNGKCEPCFIADLNKEYEEAQKKEQQKILRMDKRRLKEGYTHKVVAWVHPSRGGDDYMIDIYYGAKPTDAQIKASLRKQGSRVLDDFKVHDLKQLVEEASK